MSKVFLKALKIPQTDEISALSWNPNILVVVISFPILVILQDLCSYNPHFYS